MAFLPAIAAIAGIAGTGLSAIAASNNADYQSQVAKNNAITAQQNADYAHKAGEQQAAAASLRGAEVGGRIRAAIAANGVDVNGGSAVDVQDSQRRQSKVDTETVLNNADLQSYGYRTQASNYQAQSDLYGNQSDQSLAGGGIGLLGSAASLSKSFPGFSL